MATFPRLRGGTTENQSNSLVFNDRERKRAEKESPAGTAVRSFSENLCNTFDSLDCGVCAIDMKTCEILYANPYIQDIFGDVEGRICWQVLQENQSGPCPFCNNRQLLNEQGEPAGVVVWEFRNTRNHRWYECRDSAVHWSDGRMVRLEIARDITEWKRKKEECARKMKLEALCVLMERIVHDFNNLLTVSTGYLSLARLHVPPTDPVSAFLEKTEEVFMESGKLSVRLFALTGECRPVMRKVALESVLLDSTHLYLRDSEPRAAFSLADPLWPVRIDENQIRQVIFQILDNVRQAMPEGGQVTIRAENVSLSDGEKEGLPSGPYVCWSVEDRGIGIFPDDLCRIFNPDFTNWPGDQSKKTGWGLAACSMIIKNHKGHIECSSEPGVGTTFVIYLPADRDL